jgi:hypothetical protein
MQKKHVQACPEGEQGFFAKSSLPEEENHFSFFCIKI